jgi:4-diphosphocytidyl-2-C-methyl-D-erythritol kinase
MQVRRKQPTADMPETIVEIARAKINLALHVLGRRSDGYHELDSIVAFADFGDRLTLEESDATSLAVTGPFAADVPVDAQNLVLRANTLFCEHIECLPVRFFLEKNLPVASGIGGGSADAAAALRGLLRLTDKIVPTEVMNKIALQLGADVPVCLLGQAVRMQGVGDVLTPLTKKTANAIVMANPLVPCGTAAVFKKLNLQNGQPFGSALDPDDQRQWRNDLTEPAVAVVPEIAKTLSALQAIEGLHTIRMSGSGATCFGLVDDVETATDIAMQLQRQHPDWWIVSAALC